MKNNPFKTEVLDYASKLDAVSQAYGEVLKAASAIVEERDNPATLYLLNHTAQIIKSPTALKDLKRLANALKDSIFKFYGSYTLFERQDSSFDKEDTRSLPELLVELNKLVGLKEVKTKVNDLIAFQTVQILRSKQGLQSQKGTMHLAFTGNPGTGKTTVARIVGRIYKQLGLLSKGHFVEVSRTDLIAGYQGQTALKVKKVIEGALGGVLFIDEAYSITENDHSDSYGRECLTELTKALEDYRDDLVVIVAGYTEPMSHFFASNPGLESRFNTFIEFPDYIADELHDMFIDLCADSDYFFGEEVAVGIYDHLSQEVDTKEMNFSNGRLVRNIYDTVTMNHARRVAKLQQPSFEDLATLSFDDIQEFCSNA